MTHLYKRLLQEVSIAPLITFRIVFGALMFLSVVRFMWRGWVEALYVKPQFYFSYYGFGWVKPLDEMGMYMVFILMAVAAVGIMLGSYYRLSATLFFVCFTYVELIDKTNYLNHYYFVSLMSFLMMLLPAHRAFSVDVWRKPWLRLPTVPAWVLAVVKLQIGVVYVYAGIAKLNTEWLLQALPLRLWLPAHNDLPLIGSLLETPQMAYVFSWAGALFDLSVVFLLLWTPTRIWAYAAVVVFHLTTGWLFPIGMFPYIMMGITLVFFSANFHQTCLRELRRVGAYLLRFTIPRRSMISYRLMPIPAAPCYVPYVLSILMIVQVLLPWRYLLYPGDLFWTEQGYRFSWRVMLMEKAGYTVFHVQDTTTGRYGDVMPGDYLTCQQEKMMSTQPDMIVQFAHFLKDELQQQGLANPVITAEAYVTLNGRGSRLLLDPQVDLTQVDDGWRHKSWIQPFEP